MHGLLRASCGAIALLCLQPVCAASVYRCDDGRGHISYSQLGCRTDQQQSVQHAYNPPPGADNPVQLAPVKNQKTRHARKEKAAATGITVVGEKQDGCGNRVTGSERRQAIIREQVRTGMTLADVESALGRPDKVSGRNGQTQYHYRDNQGNTRQVSFDQDGCVRGKR